MMTLHSILSEFSYCTFISADKRKQANNAGISNPTLDSNYNLLSYCCGLDGGSPMDDSLFEILEEYNDDDLDGTLWDYFNNIATEYMPKDIECHSDLIDYSIIIDVVKAMYSDED